jgi:aryl-alcohol dehydrogenase-like predicted oxidoreductase
MAENPAKRKTEIAALQLGLDLGISLIDTAEMYGEGAAEELIGEAIKGRRAEVFWSAKFIRTTPPATARSRRASAVCAGSGRIISIVICSIGAGQSP